jgi:hypothetical protein
MSKFTIFDFLKDLSENKQDILDETNESQYDCYMINRYLSMHPTTMLYANEMNKLYFLPKRMQYDYLLHSIRKDRRFFKYVKSEKPEDIDLVKEYFGYGSKKAKDALRVLSEDDITYMKEKLSKGGHRARKKAA